MASQDATSNKYNSRCVPSGMDGTYYRYKTELL